MALFENFELIGKENKNKNFYQSKNIKVGNVGEIKNKPLGFVLKADGNFNNLYFIKSGIGYGLKINIKTIDDLENFKKNHLGDSEHENEMVKEAEFILNLV